MNCLYCFNSQVTKNYDLKMSEETLRHIFEITIPNYPEVNFIWHGGEPLSMGLPFYQKVVKLQAELNSCGTRIKNSIQSNMTMLTEEFASFLKENGFTISGSFDGTQNQVTRGNSERILIGIRNAREKIGNCGVISVVSTKNIDHLIEDYEWFKSQKIGYSLNPYISKDPKDELTVPARRFVERFQELFDYWLTDTTCDINLRYFRNFIEHILLNKRTVCTFNSCLGKWMAIRYNGDIYPCNRDYPEEYSFGNVMQYDNIREAFDSPGFIRLTTEAVERRNKCKSCPIYGFCNGGCNHNALMYGGVQNNHNYWCDTLIPMYEYIEEKLRELVVLPIDEVKDHYNPYVVKALVDRKMVK
ncbi:MAG: radical SAM protein [Lachnospiraceae bacterium]|nr:radical SAM protein [Lachnospiraceae bacterium]